MTSLLAVGGLVVLALVMQAAWRNARLKRERVVAALASDMAALGELAPDTLHPRVDPDRCIGSGACVRACPEHEVLALKESRAYLVNPLACVGHSACADACPLGAIELVFGTATRGVELPHLDRTFQTNQPGVYVVGELGGMGLIRNAVKQGKEAADAIAADRRRGRGDAPDAVVVGAGPAGLAATLGLMKAGLSVQLIDGTEFGGTIRHYPRAKIVMNGRLDLPLYGAITRKSMRKEELLAIFEDVRRKTALPVETGVTALGLVAGPEGLWTLRTSKGERHTANVVLALGRRGAPRKLGVPGEDLPHVHYRVLEPEAFAGRRAMVVGGGNSAVESALALAEQGGCASVALSYRRAELARVRSDNRRRIEGAIAEGRVVALMPSDVVAIEVDRVVVERMGERTALPTDAVVVQIGGTAPAALLATFGIELRTKFGVA